MDPDDAETVPGAKAEKLRKLRRWGPDCHAERVMKETLVPFVCVQQVEEAVANKRELPVEALQSIVATQVGSLLYKGEGLVVRYKLFVRSIEERLKQLEDLGHTADDMSNFKTVVVAEARVVMESAPAFERKVCSLRFLGERMEISILSVNDEWGFRLAAKMHSLAISQSQVRRMPWEELIFDDKKLDGLPETIMVPEEHLTAAKNVREACLNILKGYEWATFADMVKIVSAQSESLLELDRFWALELHFLKSHARALGEKKVKDGRHSI